jgi:hypothetical protein
MSNARTVGERKAVAKLKAAWAHVIEVKKSEVDKLEVQVPEPAWADLEAAVEALTRTDEDE